MSDTLKHKFTSLKPDDPDTTLVRPSNWNAEHAFNGGVNGQYLQRWSANSDGVRWDDGEGFDVAGAATGGTGTALDPFTGWETAVEGRPPGARIHFKKAHYDQQQEITIQDGWHIYGDSATECVVTVANGIKGWVYDGVLSWANVYMHDITISGTSSAPGGTLELVSIKDGIHFTFERVHLQHSSTYALRAQGVINLTVNMCDIEANNVGGVYLGGADINTQFVNDWTIRYTFFQGVGANQLATDGFIRVQNATHGEIIGNAMESGTYGVVLIGAGRVAINNNFMEFQNTANVATTANISGCIEIGHNHLHNTAANRIDLQFNVGPVAHDQLYIHDNAHVVLGAVHSSVTFFDPGSTHEYAYVRNKLYPVANRGLFGVIYVAGYFPDDDAFFTSDVVKTSPDPVLNGGLRFSLVGESHLRYDQINKILELAAVQADESLSLYGAGTTILLDSALMEMEVDSVQIMSSNTTQTIWGTVAVFNTGIQIPVVATGSLPAAGSSMNGRVMIENAGAGDQNLIIYAGDQRFRIDGGTAF